MNNIIFTQLLGAASPDRLLTTGVTNQADAYDTPNEQCDDTNSEQWDAEDLMPLSIFAQQPSTIPQNERSNPARQVRQVRRKIKYIESKSEWSDDSDKDEDFNPKELESTDSNDENDTSPKLHTANITVQSTPQLNTSTPEAQRVMKMKQKREVSTFIMQLN